MGGTCNQVGVNKVLPPYLNPRIKICPLCYCSLYIRALCNNCGKYILGPRGTQEIALERTLSFYCIRCGATQDLAEVKWIRFFCRLTHRQIFVSRGL